jgi:hypothetical protein
MYIESDTNEEHIIVEFKPYKIVTYRCTLISLEFSCAHIYSEVLPTFTSHKILFTICQIADKIYLHD